MISKQELLEYSRAVSIGANVAEKDYVIGWLLSGFNNNKNVNQDWIFKGGTCLKKCYFETYRFSEDLDFTVLDESHINESSIMNVLLEVVRWVYDESGIELPEDLISVDIFKNPRGVTSAQGKIGYIGPLQRRSGISKIKLDISSDEILVLDPKVQDVFHPYSDKSVQNMKITCYAYQEVFAEKVRALAERSRPRDLYDVIHLYHNKGLLQERELLLSTLQDKCEFKGIETPGFAYIDNHPQKDELRSEWENMLKHQISILPPLDHYWNELPGFFSWVYGKELVSVLQEVPKGKDTAHWSPGRLTVITPLSAYVDRIQFAASNRLCISLRYNNEVRTVEPYSFRTSKADARLFYGFELEAGQIKCYRLDRFQSVDILSETFNPRYMVEISAKGPMRSPVITRRRRR